MIDDADTDDFQKQARVEARQFFRLFSSEDGKAVLRAIKRDMGWDAPSPVPDKEGNIPTERVRDWMGARSVIGMIHEKISLGERLSEH
jgi:hypothetical protein